MTGRRAAWGSGLALVQEPGRAARRHACARAQRRARTRQRVHRAAPGGAGTAAVGVAAPRVGGRRRARVPDAAAAILVVDDNQDAAGAIASTVLELRATHVAMARPRRSSSRELVHEPRRGAARHRAAGHGRLRAGAAPPGAPATARLHLIAVTGYGQEHDRRRSRDAGFDEHLVKPVDLDRLVRLVEAVRAAPPSPSANT